MQAWSTSAWDLDSILEDMLTPDASVDYCVLVVHLT